MSLFDDIKRTDTRRIDPRESLFHYLNRSARPDDAQVRNLLESWFEEYLHEARNHLRGRLRGNDSAAGGALFELMVHELFIQLGCEVTVLDVDGTKKQPDFRVRHGNCHFYVEATVTRSQPVFNPAEEDVMANIKTLRSPCFSFSFDEMKSELSKHLPKREVVRPFQELLETHTPDAVQKMIDEGGSEAAPSAKITDNDWSLQGRLVPRDPPYVEKKPTVMLGPGRTGILNSTPVQCAIKKKANKYRSLDAPLLVAVNVRMLGFSEDEELEVLFGKEQYTIDRVALTFQGRSTREPDGVWVRRGPPHTRYTRLKGVIMFRNISPWNLHAPCCLYFNPFAGDMKLPDVLCRLPYVRVHEGKIQPFEGENIGRLLGINDDWQTKA